MVLYSFLFITLYADWKANRIKAGDGIQVYVHMTTEAEAGMAEQAGKTLILLGSTSRYVFLYSPTDDQSFIIPAENIATLYPVKTRHDSSTESALPKRASEQEKTSEQPESESENTEQKKTNKENN